MRKTIELYMMTGSPKVKKDLVKVLDGYPFNNKTKNKKQTKGKK